MHSDLWISSLRPRDRVRAFHVIQFARTPPKLLGRIGLTVPPIVITNGPEVNL